MRTAIITEIKGLSIQTQQNTFVLFTLFKLTFDERKTLTKISTRSTSHNHSPNQCTFWTRRNKKTSKQPNKEKKEEKAVCNTSNALSRLHNFTDTPYQKDVIPLNFLQHFTPHYIEHSYSHLVENLYAHKTRTLDATTVKRKHSRPPKPKSQIPSSKPRTPTAAKNLTT